MYLLVHIGNNFQLGIYLGVELLSYVAYAMFSSHRYYGHLSKVILLIYTLNSGSPFAPNI